MTVIAQIEAVTYICLPVANREGDFELTTFFVTVSFKLKLSIASYRLTNNKLFCRTVAQNETDTVEGQTFFWHSTIEFDCRRTNSEKINSDGQTFFWQRSTAWQWYFLLTVSNLVTCEGQTFVSQRQKVHADG